MIDNEIDVEAYNQSSKKEHKFHAVPTVRGDLAFASTAEARRYDSLKLLEKAGQISGLEIHPVYVLQPRYVRPWDRGTTGEITYEADFAYKDLATGRKVVEDVKGVRTAVFMLKKRLFEKIYNQPITIIEVGDV